MPSTRIEKSHLINPGFTEAVMSETVNLILFEHGVCVCVTDKTKEGDCVMSVNRSSQQVPVTRCTNC